MFLTIHVSKKGLWFFSLLIFAILYFATCQRGVSWQDSGMFQWRVLQGDYHGNIGLALAHPMYIAACRTFIHLPIGNFTTKMNFFSGLGMAVALANLAVLMTLLTGRWWIGLAISAMLSVSHTVWWLATIAEVYTWSVAGLTTELWLLVLLIRNPKWQTLSALGLVNGLGLSIHNFALLPLPVYVFTAIVLIIRRKLPMWSLYVAAGSFMLGAGLYIYMIIDLALQSGDIIGAILSALFGKYTDAVLNTSTRWRFIRVNAALACLNFLGMTGPLAIAGWLKMSKKIGRSLAVSIGAITIIEILFVVRYPIPDQFTFLLPTLIVVSIATGVGMAVLADVSSKWKIAVICACIYSIVIPPVVYSIAPRALRLIGFNINRERKLPFRDEIRYWVVPWKHNERSAQRFATTALKQASPNGIIIADSTSQYPLLLIQRLDGIGKDVSIQSGFQVYHQYITDKRYFCEVLQERPLYTISPAIIKIFTTLLNDFEISCPEGKVLYQLQWAK